MNNRELEQKTKEIAISLIYEKGFVSSVDVLLKLGYLTKDDYESWRRGRITYLEKVFHVNLSKLSAINRTIRKSAAELKLEKSWTAYNKYGKGKIRLVFSKSGNKNIEDAYATHYVSKSLINEIKMNKASV